MSVEIFYYTNKRVGFDKFVRGLGQIPVGRAI